MYSRDSHLHIITRAMHSLQYEISQTNINKEYFNSYSLLVQKDTGKFGAKGKSKKMEKKK